jgi:hypothetical protein
LLASDGEATGPRRDGVTTAQGQPPAGPRVLIAADMLDTPSGVLGSPLSSLLAGFSHVRDEEITGRGLEIVAHHQLARDHGGRIVVWRGRERRPGRGTISSGLRYDDATPSGQEGGHG